MAAQAVEDGASPASAHSAPTAVGWRTATGRADGRRCWSPIGATLGLALLGACAGREPAPGPLMVGGELTAAFKELARDELRAELRLAPTLASVALAPGALWPAPVPAPRPRLAVVLPPPPPPRKPVAHERIGWIPQPKPERRPTGPRNAIWPPPWKPDPADLRRLAEPAAGPLVDPRSAISPPPWKPGPPDLPFSAEHAAGALADPHSAIWPPPWKPEPADLPVAAEHAAAPSEDRPGSDGPATIVVAHGGARSTAIDDAIAVSEVDQLLSQQDRAAREALLAGDAATALGIYERLASRFPEERTVRIGRALALERLGRGSEAQALYQTMLGRDPEDLGAKTALLGILAEAAPEEALRLLRRLAQHHPGDARLRAQIAMVLARQGALPAAIADQRQAVALDPANPDYRINLAVLYDRAGGIDAAVEHYRSALELATLGGAPIAQLDAIAARLHHLRARQRPAAPSATP